MTFCTNTEKNAEDRWVSVALKWFDQLEKIKSCNLHRLSNQGSYESALRFIDFYFVTMCSICYQVSDGAEEQCYFNLSINYMHAEHPGSK